jgi:hypothetical protein
LYANQSWEYFGGDDHPLFWLRRERAISLGILARIVIYLNLRYCFSRYDTMLFEDPAFITYPDEGGSRPL